MKVSEMKTHEEVLAGLLRDPEFREIWERTALAREIANRLIGYRIEHGLTQTGLARIVGMQQPAIARLESGEKNPTWETLARLSSKLGLEIVVTITPPRRTRRSATAARKPKGTARSQARSGRVAVTMS